MQRSIFSLISISAIPGKIVFASLDAKAQEAGTVSSEESGIAAGRDLSFDRNKGNYLACHVMGDSQLPGNIGPSLFALKSRFPGNVKLREQIYGTH